MTKALQKNIRRCITGSIGRYVSIVLIILLGVAFFAGLKLTRPAMTAVFTQYIESSNLFDLRLLSTWGFDDEDVEDVAQVDGVEYAVGSYYADFIWQQDADTLVYRAQALNAGMNLPELIAGEMPQAANEILGDSRCFTEDMIGQTISLADCNDEDTLEDFAYTEYTLVGICRTPLYLDTSRGTTSLGNGSITGFVLMEPEGFTSEYYMEIYVTYTEDLELYSDEYDDAIDALSDNVEAAATQSVERRVDDTIADAEQEIADGEQELADKKAEAEEELTDAWAELEDARVQLEDARAELDDAKVTLADALQELEDGEAELADAKQELDDAKALLDEGAEAIQSGYTSWESALAAGWDAYNEGQDALDAAIAEGEATLADSKAQLDALEKTLSDGESQLADGTAQYESGLTQWQSGYDQYIASLSEYAENQAAYEEGLAQYEAALEQFETATGMTLDEALEVAAQLETASQTLESTAAALDEAKAILDETKAQLDALEESLALMDPDSEEYAAALEQWQAGSEAYNAALAEYEENLTAYQEGLAQYEAQAEASAELVATATQLDETRQTLEASAAALEQGKAQLDDAAEELDTQKATLDAAKATLDESESQLDTLRAALKEGWSQYNAGVAELNTQKITQQNKLDSAKASLEEFEAGIEAYYEGLDSYNEGVQTLADGWAEYEDGLAEFEDGEADYAEGLAEYEDGLAEYEDGVAEFNEEIADAEQELVNAREELADLEDVELYVLDRSTNSGYVTFESDSQIVDRLAGVFPVFFFLIAALVCSTTMTRMVDDDRTQIGTMRALGYSRGSILAKYLIYSGTAAIVGCLLGFFLGGCLFPFVIWKAYQMIYNIKGFLCVYDYSLLALSMAASLLCSAGTTWFACRRTMESTPADLIRPAAPAAGKRIFLERITPLWSRLKFLHKVTLRNIFRFKKRMFMMILGIAGCTALVLTGFGINDSIADIANYQYDDIQKYDLTVTYDDPITQDDLDWTAENCGAQIETQAVARMWSGDLTGSEATKTVYFVASDDENINKVFDLHLNGETVAYPGTGEVLITQKLATLAGVEVGDTVTLTVNDSTRGEATVVGLVENYVYNYVYMTGETYAAVFSEDCEPETLVLRLSEDVDEHSVSAAFSGQDAVSNVSVVSDTRSAIDNMMNSLNYVVILVLACAGALAFVVLFNLGNINISERAREIATIKVLGFHARETGAYVFRENFILSLMGICCGLPLGVALHAFVIAQIQVDMVYFKTILKPVSYLLTVGMVILFTVATDLILRRKIRGIDMAESLKSVE
ncbi:MAG: ABC transporter permease [Clostridiales bacterium]|nr:ABC transporter permease [Clostridiales bacterium]